MQAFWHPEEKDFLQEDLLDSLKGVFSGLEMKENISSITQGNPTWSLH